MHWSLPHRIWSESTFEVLDKSHLSSSFHKMQCKQGSKLQADLREGRPGLLWLLWSAEKVWSRTEIWKYESFVYSIQKKYDILQFAHGRAVPLQKAFQIYITLNNIQKKWFGIEALKLFVNAQSKRTAKIINIVKITQINLPKNTSLTEDCASYFTLLNKPTS